MFTILFNRAFFIVIICTVYATSVFSQSWMNELLEDNSRNNLTLTDYQNAFNAHCKKNKIEKGYSYINGIKEKAPGWKQFKRWEHYWSSRVNLQTGAFPSENDYRVANQLYAEQKRNKESSIRNQTGEWINLGPFSSNGGYAGVGRLSQIAFHPTNPSIYWVTSPLGGVWKTSDDGQSWETLTADLEIQACTGIAIQNDYETSKTIYLGTGDQDSWRHDNGIGVLKSTDGGNSWNKTGLEFKIHNDYSVNRILINPEDYNIVYAATSNGVYQTIDAGETWINIFSEEYIADLEFHPTDPTILYASSRYWGTIYKLTESGFTPSLVYNDYSNGARRIELSVSPDAPEVVYAVASNDDGGLHGILKSTDTGDHFSSVFELDEENNINNILGYSPEGTGNSGQGNYDLTIAVDPNNSDVVYCGGINTWKSEDGGLSWELSTFWWNKSDLDVSIVHADKHFLAFNNNTLYECNDGGLYRKNQGNPWENISNGIDNSQLYRLGVSQTDPTMTITGLQDNGSKLSSNGDWSDILGGDGMECFIDYTDENIQYGSLYYGDLRKTTDKWESKYSIKPEDSQDGAWITPFAIDPNNHNAIYTAMKKVWKSHDGGESWTSISNFNITSTFDNIAISPSDSDIIWVSEDDNLWKTTNGGEDWDMIDSNLPTQNINDLLIHATDPNKVWVTYGGYSNKNVFRTGNGGNSWGNISQGIPNVPVNAIIQNKLLLEEDEFYAGTDFGVYIKRGDKEWALFNDGMPKVPIDDLDIYYDTENAEESIIRAATYGRGLWESRLFKLTEPTSDFAIEKDTIAIGEHAQYIDLSANTPISWLWEFEAGTPSQSSEKNPTVTYSEEGDYKVKLTTTNAIGNDVKEKLDFVHVTCDYLNMEQIDVCSGNNYEFPDGVIYEGVMKDSIYKSIFISETNCDSTILSVLSVQPIYDEFTQVKLCNGENFTFPDGTIVENVQDSIEHTNMLTSVYGCDSVVTILLTSDEYYESTEEIVVCSGESHTFPDGGKIFNIEADTSHISSLVRTLGCDSIIYTNLKIVPSFYEEEEVILCKGDTYTFHDGTMVENAFISFIHKSKLVTIDGCDSIIKSNITVNNTSIAYSIVEDANTLCVDGEVANYAWMDCDAGIVIDGENEDCFTPSYTGGFAAIISNDSEACIDTSACFYVIVSSLENEDVSEIVIYPNPSQGVFSIGLDDSMDAIAVEVQLTDILGNDIKIDQSIVDPSTISVKTIPLPEGIYLLKIKSGDKIYIEKVYLLN